MVKSMTAFSRLATGGPLGRFLIEIHSVNRKMLDMSIYLPKDLLRFDMEIRKWISALVERGQITVRISLQSEGLPTRLLENFYAQLKGLKEGWEKIATDLGYGSKAVDLPFLVTQMQTVAPIESKQDEEALRAALKQLVDSALDEFIQMKEREGKVLSLDMEKRLKILEQNLAVIETKREEPLHRYRKKLHERFKEMGHLHGEAQEKIAREVALLAEKMDVTEELVRLRTHIEQFRLHLFSKERAIGRTLDFLTQEMHREINTLGSKSSDSDISLCVVTMKGELEKIREQVQNIE
ncbi:MAG: YicC family protein [Verrucomicrobia bacterium]|nr:YicC family protein [Verrucomicrobiota bacterium]